MSQPSVTTYRLYRGDLLLGTVIQPAMLELAAWCGGVFHPVAGFERVRPLFENELHLLNAGRRPEWKEIWEEIQRSGLKLVPMDGGETLTDFVIHIENDQAWWKLAGTP